MIAKGRNNLQAEIDTKKDILDNMIERFPNVIKNEIAQYKALLDKVSKENAEGDIEIEISLMNNSLYNDAIDIESNILLYHYFSLAIMIYSFAETSLEKICSQINLSTPTPSRNKLNTYYNRVWGKYKELPKLSKVWKGKTTFQKYRNEITHQMATNNESLTPDYLHTQLDAAYNMLCIVLRQIYK